MEYMSTIEAEAIGIIYQEERLMQAEMANDLKRLERKRKIGESVRLGLRDSTITVVMFVGGTIDPRDISV